MLTPESATPTPILPQPGLADLCRDCEDSVHPEACPTAYVTCPRMRSLE